MFAKVLKPVVAAAITAAVFLTMRVLIMPSGNGPPEVEPPPLVDITRQKRDEESMAKLRTPPQKPEMQKLPPLQKNIQTNLTTIDNSGLTGFIIPKTITKPQAGGALISDRHATPLVRIPPEYPMRPRDSGTEGWVMVEFTINLAGGVEDVVIVDSEPPKVFDRAVVRAIQRWKYQPKLVNGKPVAQYNMRELVRFELGH